MNEILNLRVISGTEIREPLRYVQYATEIPVEFHFEDYTIPEGAEARFYLLKKSGAEIYTACEIAGNSVILHPTTQTFAEHGRQKAQIQIVVGGKVLMSYIIKCDIEQNLVVESAIPSKDEFGILDDLINTARESIKNADAATQSATDAAGTANDAAQAATESKEAADTATQEAQEATKAATDAASSAESAAGAATEAAQAAAEETAKAVEAAGTATSEAASAAEAANAAAQRVEDMISQGRGLVPEGGEKDQVLTSDAEGAAHWTDWSAMLSSSPIPADNIDGVLPEENGGTGTTTVLGGNKSLMGKLHATSATNMTGWMIALISNSSWSGGAYISLANFKSALGTIPVTQGGTGATTADAARKSLGVSAQHQVMAEDNVGYVQIAGEGSYYYFRPYAPEKVVLGSSPNPFYKLWTGRVEVTQEAFVCKPTYDRTVTYAPNLFVGTGGTFSRTTNVSSRDIKHDIAPLQDAEIAAEKLYDVDVRQFRYNDDVITDEDDPRGGKILPGFIIEELAEVYPVAVDRPSDDKKDWSWNAQYLIPPMLKLIQDQKKEIEELKAKVDQLAK